jgi:hypothetical protein
VTVTVQPFFLFFALRRRRRGGGVRAFDAVRGWLRARCDSHSVLCTQSPTMARSALALLLCAALLGGSAAEVAKGDALRASAPAPLKAADPLKGPLGRTCAADGALEDAQLSAPLNRRAERAARSRWFSLFAASRFTRNAQRSHSLSALRDVPHEPLRDLRVRHAASRADFACTTRTSSLTDSRLALRVSSNYCGPGWCSSGAQAACSCPLEPARLPVSLALFRLREREQLQLRRRAAGRLLHGHVLHGARQVLRLLRPGRLDDLRPGFGQGPGAVQHPVHGLPEQLQAAGFLPRHRRLAMGPLAHQARVWVRPLAAQLASSAADSVFLVSFRITAAAKCAHREEDGWAIDKAVGASPSSMCSLRRMTSLFIYV